MWHNFEKKNKTNPRASLLQHVTQNHKDILKQKPILDDCFQITFLEQPPNYQLDWFENKWHTTVKATLNIQKIIIPFVKYNTLKFIYTFYC